jgi:hypothetical protein
MDSQASPIAVWVGEGLVDFEPRIEVPNLSFAFRIIDIRDPVDDDPRFDSMERQILSGLKAVDQAHGGVFRRLLELPAERHQREFVRIAASLGYSALAIRAAGDGPEQQAD